MPVPVIDALPTLPPQLLKRKVWTRQACAQAQAAGLWEGQHLELLDGELIDKMGKNQPHVLAAAAVLRTLMNTFGAYCVLSDAPIRVSTKDDYTNEPEPPNETIAPHAAPAHSVPVSALFGCS
jgi:hypothetical protein